MKVNFKGFTLLEIMVVIMVVAVLASVALPKYNDAVEKARAQEGINALLALFAAERSFQIENNSFTNVEGNLDIQLAGLRFFGARNYTACPANQSAACSISMTRNNVSRSVPAYTLTVDNNGIIHCPVVAGGFCSKLVDGVNIVTP